MGKQYVIICQRGELEIKSGLLAMSLLPFLDRNDIVVVAVPAEKHIDFHPTEETLLLFRRAGIDVVPFDNPWLQGADTALPFRLTKKFYALQKFVRSNGSLVFLDSDILCLSQPSFPGEKDGIRFAAKAVDRLYFDLDPLYRHFTIDDPGIRCMTTVGRQISLPYFNSGVMYIKSSVVQLLTGTALAMFNEIVNKNLLGDHMFYAEQLAFTLSVLKNGFPFTFLNDRLNFPARALQPDTEFPPALAHYHTPESLSVSPLLQNKTLVLLNRYPTLRNLVLRNPEWQSYFRTGKYGIIRPGWRSSYSKMKSGIKFVLGKE